MHSFFIFSATIIIGWASAEDLRLLDLPPEEAQQYIESKDQSLKYAPKIDSNVPAVRVLGDTPTNVLEDIYLANQYHGQDGLGSYLYGYSVPDIAKTEKKIAHGDLKGAYQYINGGGQEIKVQYWDDGTGFHQIDNLPEVLPKQVEDSPDVQAAKQEFFKRWHEEAERNKHPVTAPGSGGVLESGQSQYQPEYVPGPQSGQPSSGHYQQGESNLGAPSGPGNQGYNTNQNGYSGQPGVQIGHGSSGYQTRQPSQGPGQGSHGISQVGSQSGGQTSQGGYPTGQIYSGTSQSGSYSGHSGSQGQTGGQGGSQNGNEYGQSQYPVRPVSSGGAQIGSYTTGQQGGFPADASAGYNPQGGSLVGQTTSSGKYGQNAGPGNQQSRPTLTGQSGYQSGQLANDQGCCGGQYSSNQENYAQNHGGNEWEYKPTEEEQGPPRGFFYNFDYPVGIIVQKQGAGGAHKRESLEHLYDKNKANFEQQVNSGASLDGSSQSGYQIHA